MRKIEIKKELALALKVFKACDEAIPVGIKVRDDRISFEFALREYGSTTEFVVIDLEDNELELWQYHNFRSYFLDFQIKNIKKAIEYVNAKIKEESK